MLKMVGSYGSPLASITETPHSSLKYAARMCLRFGQKSIRSIPSARYTFHICLMLMSARVRPCRLRTAHRFLLFDHDSKFGFDVVSVVREIGSHSIRTAFR